MTETNAKHLRQYVEAGVGLLLLNRFDVKAGDGRELGKAPIHANWPKRTYEYDAVIDWVERGHNAGVRMGDGWGVLDIDPRNGGIEGQKVLEEKYGLNFEKFAKVHTGRGDGGLHVYMKIPRGWRGMMVHPEIPGVELKHHNGMQVVSAGSVHPTGGVYKWHAGTPLQATADCPQLLLEAYTVKRPSKELAGEGSESFGAVEPPEIARALSHLDPKDFRDHEHWLNLMMSCHWISGGAAREEFVEWSTQDQDYSGHGEIIGQRWDSFSQQGGFSTRVLKGAFLFKEMNRLGVGEHGPRVSLNHDFEDLEEEDLEADQAITQTEELRVLKEMNSKHALVNLAGRAFVMGKVVEDDENGNEVPKVQFSQTRDMREFYKSRHIHHQIQGPTGVKTVRSSHYEFWENHPNRREYGNVVFDPAREKEFETSDGSKTLNLWEGFAFDPKKRGEGSWELLDHVIREGICSNDEELYQYVLNWIAFSYQNPARPQRVALVMRGSKGVGKGTLARTWLAAWGLHGVATDDGDDLFGKYNADMEYKCGVFLDEAFWAGDRSVEGKIKSRITEPKLRVEQKHQPKRSVRNFIKIMMASNNDFVVPAGEDERRFVVVDVNSAFMSDGKLWKALNSQMIRGGNQAFFYDMINRDLGDFDPETHRVMTDALRSQVRHTFGEIAEWWIEVLEDGILPHQIGDWSQSPARVPVNSLRDHFVEHIGGVRRGDWAYNFDQKFFAALKKFMPKGYALPRIRVRVDPEDEEYMALDVKADNRVRCYALPSLDECRAVAEHLFGKDLFGSLEQERIRSQIESFYDKATDAAMEGDFDQMQVCMDAADALLAAHFEGGDLI